jgi:hypothetical protein
MPCARVLSIKLFLLRKQSILLQIQPLPSGQAPGTDNWQSAQHEDIASTLLPGQYSKRIPLDQTQSTCYAQGQGEAPARKGSRRAWHCDRNEVHSASTAQASRGQTAHLQQPCRPVITRRWSGSSLVGHVRKPTKVRLAVHNALHITDQCRIRTQDEQLG